MSEMALEKRAQMVQARLEQERQQARSSGPGPVGLEAAGPPTWSRAAWDEIKARTGHYPFGPQGDGLGFIRPPSMEGAPDWVYDLMLMRRPPVDVNPGQAALSDGVTDDLAIWKVR